MSTSDPRENGYKGLIESLECSPEEWETREDTYQCEKCGNNFNRVSGWDEDCNDYTFFRCPMCGNVVGEE